MSRLADHDWGAVGEEWERRRPQRLWRAHSDAVNAALLRDWLPAAGARRALKTDAFDEAFGGGLASLLRERFEEVWEIDLAVAVLRAARRRHPDLRVLGADVRRLPFASGSVDGIVSLSTLDHFEDETAIHAALAECARVLRPGGRLIVTLDNPGNPLVALRNRLPLGWLRQIGLVPYYVGRTLDRRGLEAALEGAGLEALEVRAILHVPRAPAVAAARLVGRAFGDGGWRGFLRIAGAFEALGGWPTRFATGYFVAALAVRR